MPRDICLTVAGAGMGGKAHAAYRTAFAIYNSALPRVRLVSTDDVNPECDSLSAPEVRFGQNDAFAYQSRAFLEEVAGHSEEESLPCCASLEEGVRNMELLAAVTESALHEGKSVTL